MARGRQRSGASDEQAAERDRIIDAAVRLIAVEGWLRLSLAGVAAEAGLPILQVYRRFRSKQAILAAHYRRVDETVLAAPVEVEVDARPRDQLFDLLMRRFDALRPYREAVDVLRRDLTRDPLTAAYLAGRLLHSMRWMLEGAGIPVIGLGGAFAVKLTAAAYLATMRIWLRDDSPDLARTMAELDSRLRRIERWLGRGRPSRDRRESSPA